MPGLVTGSGDLISGRELASPGIGVEVEGVWGLDPGSREVASGLDRDRSIGYARHPTRANPHNAVSAAGIQGRLQ
jgi:hypothetical protein